MKENYIKIIGAIVVVMILIFSIFAFVTQKEIGEINEVVGKIKDQPLSVRILSDASSGTSPLTVNFKPLLLNSKNKVEYYWEFGDGNTSNEEQPSYIYRSSGIFNCKLTVKDGDTMVNDSFNVTVFPNNPPKIKIICKTTAFRPETIKFDVEAFDPEGEELEYNWVLIYPVIFGGYERREPFNTKNFSKFFIRNGRYVAELTVTDASGNKVTDYEVINVQVSQIEGVINTLIAMYTFTLPGQLDLLWKGLNVLGLEKYLDNNWLDMSPRMQRIISTIIKLSFGRIKYEPPIPKADLIVSDIPDINLSAYVDGTTGEVAAGGAVASSSFTIINNDTVYTAKSVYISLEKPISGDKGLDEEIAVKDLAVGLDVGVMSNKMFYNGEYTKWENCYNIEKLAPGDLINLGITVTLKEGATFNKGTYNCTLYIYQSKYIDKAEYIDEIPFTIIL